MVKKRKLIKDPHYEREAQKYSHPVPSREFLLEFLSNYGQPISWPNLLDELGIKDRIEKQGLKKRLKAMLREGQLMMDRRYRYCVVDKLPLIKGTVIAHPEGYGFLSPEDGTDDLYLSPREMKRVLHGDKVLGRCIGFDKRGRKEGAIREVIQTTDKPIIGRFIKMDTVGVVEPSDPRFTRSILITKPDTHLASGQIVLVKRLNHPDQSAELMGEIIEIIGDDKGPGVEVEMALRTYDIPFEWPKTLHKELHKLTSVDLNELDESFVKLTHLPFVTIDGEDAKDFDDAVYCEKDKRDGWLLWVAIAHVSHYVRPGTEIDKEAEKRGTSVYFPNRVIPMLPERLSNDLCSLNPNVLRLVVVCEMHVNQQGEVKRYRFYEGCIQSSARLTYNQVAHALEQPSEEIASQPFWESIINLHELYQVLASQRAERGALAFDFPELKVIFSDQQKVEKIIPHRRLISHQMIEEAMLLANICAAKFAMKHQLPILYRNHAPPDQQAFHELCMMLRIPGFKRVKKEIEPTWVAKLLEEVHKRPDGEFLELMILQSLARALYEPECRGHFGLAYPTYTHFTSPIRRYPDLLVHRAICQYLHQEKQDKQKALVYLKKMGEHCSMTERRADDAVRDVTSWLKCEYMLAHVGQVYEGIVRSITDFGLFVQLKDLYVEGLVHVTALKNDYYRYEPHRFRMKGERTGTTYGIGERLMVRVSKVNLAERKIDFELAN